MARVCTICTHKDHDEIDRRLIRGNSIAGIARYFAVSEDALGRHYENHVPDSLMASPSAQEIATADMLLADLKSVRTKTEDLLRKADAAGEIRSLPGFLRELREQIKLVAELEGRLASQPKITLQQLNIYQSPEWMKVGSILNRVLSPYPEIRSEVARELVALQADARPVKDVSYTY